MVSSTFNGKLRVFGPAGRGSILLDDAANVGLAVHTVQEHLEAGEVLRLSISGMDSIELSFLQKIPFVEHIAIHRCYPHNVAILHCCTKLRSLELSEDCGPLDFSAFAELETLKLGAFNEGNSHFGSLKALQTLHIKKLSVAASRTIALPSTLRHLELHESPLTDLDAIQSLSFVEFLSLGYLPQVQSLSPIRALRNLRAIRLLSARKITDYSAIGSCTRLSELHFEDCAAISSIGWLTRLPELRLFSLLGTNIVDGNLSALSQHGALLWVGGTNKKHFTPSLRMIENEAKRRREALGFNTKTEGERRGLLPRDVITQLAW